MALLNIPEKDLSVLKDIAELSDPQFVSLISALAEVGATLNKSEFADRLASKVRLIEPDRTTEILRVLFILYAMKDKMKKSTDEMLNNVGESVSEDREFLDAKVALLQSRLQKLTAFDGIAVTAKAMDVMTEHQNVFCSARIISDIRPVFTGAESAAAAVIIHNLKIGYHESGAGPHREFYVALDGEDIIELKNAILRAEKKSFALEAILKNSKTPYLAPKS